MTAVVRSRLRAPRVKAIARSRLDDIVAQAWNHRVTMLLAPAGSGKTTAMAEFANGSARPVAWITCGGVDDSAEGFIANLNAALHEVAPEVSLGWQTIDEAIDALVDVSQAIAVAVDDVHTLAGTAAELALGQLIDDAPESLRIVLAGRREPGFDLSAIRMMGQLLVIDSDELRFRSWEAEQLFRDLYETWLRPDDIARLARRVEGWAAGLQMFHLAARNLSPPEQRRLIDRLNGRARIVRDYLAANVLEPIGADLRAFLIDTCVLGVVTPALADELRGRPGSEHHLRELASSQLFTAAIDDDTYRYHEVLRTQLEVMLLERDGEDQAAIRYRTAGELLEQGGFEYDALRCFARAGDWAAVRSLANPAGEQLRAPTVAWIGDLPHSIVADDPWLLLARARAERLAGTWTKAIESFHAAEAKGVGTDFVDQCRTERSELAAWLDPLAQAPPNWVGPARAGCRRDPIAAANELEAGRGAAGLLAGAALRLLGGDLRGAGEAAERSINDESFGPYGIGAGLTVLAVARLLSGAAGSDRALDEAETHAERAGFGWVARIARAGLALTDRPGGIDEAARVRDQCVADGDPWGAAISTLFGGLGAARRDLPATELLAAAAGHFHSLDAGAFEGLCIVARAAYQGVDQPHAATVARATGVAGLVPIIHSFVGQTRPTPHEALAQQFAPSGDEPSAQPLHVHCLGRFEVTVSGHELDLEGLRPRARALFKMLAIHTGSAVHRETIVDALWPDGAADSGIHNLQVAVSAIRKTLARAGVPDEFGVQRHGEAYRLALPGTASDLAEFLDAAASAKAAAARDDHELAAEHASRALAIYRGELLSEDGPLDWIVTQRAWVSGVREAVAVMLAAGHLRRGRCKDAIEVCEATIVERPYADELWRTLVAAHREHGDLAAAGQAQARYDQVLADLVG